MTVLAISSDFPARGLPTIQSADLARLSAANLLPISYGKANGCWCSSPYGAVIIADKTDISDIFQPTRKSAGRTKTRQANPERPPDYQQGPTQERIRELESSNMLRASGLCTCFECGAASNNTRVLLRKTCYGCPNASAGVDE